MAYADTMSIQEADAHTLVSLLHLRDIADRVGHPFSIVSEMLDVRNRALAEVTRADDFVVSSRLVSLMLAQISETKELNSVFNDLLTPEGSEFYLKPRPTTWSRWASRSTSTRLSRRPATAVKIAIGYRLAAPQRGGERPRCGHESAKNSS